MKAIIIYDGECRFCRRQVQRISSIDKLDRFEYIPNSDPTAPKLSQGKNFKKSVIFVDEQGKAYDGSEAVAQIAIRLHGFKLIGNLIRLPGLRTFANAAYYLIGRIRYRL